MTELNKAIMIAVLTQYKKDAKEAHKIIEDAGFQLCKDFGFWHIYNPQTGKRIHVEVREGWRWTRYTVYGGMQTSDFKNEKELAKYDFVGQLNKERNTAWYEVRRGAAKYEPTQEKYRSLLAARHTQQWREEDVVKIEKKIAELQRELIHAVEERYKATAKVKEIKKDLGLRA